MPSVQYPHRRNRDGTHDSICPRCYATIATEPVETDLPPHEQSHRCQRIFSPALPPQPPQDQTPDSTPGTRSPHLVA